MLDPATPPMAHYFVRVEVVNEEGPRYQQVWVRARPGIHHTDELLEEGKKAARKLGLFPTGNADAS